MIRLISIVFLFAAQLSFGQNNIFKYLDTTHNKLNDVDPNRVKAIKACPNGKWMVIGSFRTFNSRISPLVLRLNSNGSIDTTFHSPFDYDEQTTSIELLDIEILADGSVFVLGQPGKPDNQQVYKLKPNGEIDPSFHLPFVPYGLREIEIKNEQIILCGNSAYSMFTPPYSTYYAIKLNMDGTINQRFQPNKVIGDNEYKCLALKDSSIILYGSITSYNSTPTNRVIRVSPKGELDNTFIASPNGEVRKIISITNNEYIIIGSFTTYNGSPAKEGIVRVNNAGQRINSFDFSQFATTFIYDGISIGKDSLLLIGNFSKQALNVSYPIVNVSITGSVGKKYFEEFNGNNSISAIAIDTITKRLMMVGRVNIAPEGETKKRITAQFYNMDLDGKIYNPIRAENAISTLYSMNRHLELKDSSIILLGTSNGIYKGMKYNSFCKLDKNLNLVEDTFLLNSLRYSNTMEIDYQGNYYLPYTLGHGNYSTTGLGFFVKKYLPDYTPDLNFDANLNKVSVTNGFLNSFVMQKDGRIMVLVYLNDGTNTFFLERYNADGTRDLSFHRLQWTAVYGSNPQIIKAEDQNCYYVRANNVMVIDGITCPKFFRISNEGYVDQSYRLRMPEYIIGEVFSQGDDLYLAGSFKLSNSSAVKNGTLIKINRNGYLDPSFNLEATPSGSSYIPFSNGRFIMLFVTPAPYSPASFILVNSDGSTNKDFGKHYTYGGYGLAISDNQFGVTATQLDAYNALNKLLVINLPDIKRAYQTIEGTVYKKSACSNTTGDLQEGIIVKATPGNYYAITDNNGRYKLNVDTLHSDFEVFLIEDTQLQYSRNNTCDTIQFVHFSNNQNKVDNIDFSTNSVSCSQLAVNISATNRRRCFKGKTTITVYNNTSVSHKNVTVKTIFPKYIRPISYSMPYSSKTDSLIVFTINEVLPFQTIKIEVIDSVICGIEEIRGLQQCVEASLEENENCTVGKPGWDGSYVKLITLSNTSTTFHFKLENIGIGTMADSAEYRIFYNDTLAVKKKFLLMANQYKEFEINTYNKTIRVEADQSPGYPLKNVSKIFNNACLVDKNYKAEYRVSTAMDNERNDYSITCGQILDSFDPNDKNVLPQGQGINNILSGKEKLTYTIRFQNTGTDTAFTIKIVDTLSEFLDVSTLHAHVASHPFLLKVSGTDKLTMTFIFNGINLPHKDRNLLGSQGYISYTIYPKKDLLPGTKISNAAGIYFDYNSAIETNTVEQTIGTLTAYYNPDGLAVIEKLITTQVSDQMKTQTIFLYPNPVYAGNVYIKSDENKIKKITIYDAMGNEILVKNINDYHDTINVDRLAVGMYIYHIYTNSGEIIYSGKLIKE